jgi:hypothetical protein
MQIQTIHSLDFCFGFYYYFQLWGLILYPNYIIEFFVEIIFESKNNILNFQYFWTKDKFEVAKKH